MKIEQLKQCQEIPTQTLARAVWSYLIEPADYRFTKFSEQMGLIGGLEALDYLVSQDLGIQECFPGISENLSGAICGWCLRYRQLDLASVVDQIHQSGATLLTPESENWPGSLTDLEDTAPVILWALGNMQSLPKLNECPTVAMVGARAASNYGMEVASQFACELASQGDWIISGGAYGIDAASHRGALRGGGNTVVVLAGGLGNLYPAANESLFATISETGLLLSESPFDERPAKRRFLTRNRLIAALSQVCVVVEAAARSGAINTANHANELGRILAAVPGPVTSSYAVGSNELLRQGATCVTSSADIQELLSPLENLRPTLSETSPASLFSGLSQQGIKVLDSLPVNHWLTVEKIALAAGLGVNQTQSELGLLELDGKAEQRAGRYRRATSNTQLCFSTINML